MDLLDSHEDVVSHSCTGLAVATVASVGPFIITVGESVESLKEMRTVKGLTQGEIAKKIGCHVQFVSNMERGISRMPPRFIKKYAKVLDVYPERIIRILVDRYETKLRTKSKIQNKAT